MLRISLLILLLLGITLTAHAQAPDIRPQLRLIATDLTGQLKESGKKRVAMASFLDSQNKETELGGFIADKFLVGMMASKSFLMIDRSQFDRLLRENKFSLQDLLDPQTAPKLGKQLGAEVIIVGNYTVLDNSVDITVKAIDLEQGVMLAVAEGVVPRTSEMDKLRGYVEKSETTEKERGVSGNQTNSKKSGCFAKNLAGATIRVIECVPNGKRLICQLVISNERPDKGDATFNYSSQATYIIADMGTEYRASGISIGNTNSGYFYGNIIPNTEYTLINGVEVNGTIIFDTNGSAVTKLQALVMEDQGLRCLSVPVVSSGGR